MDEKSNLSKQDLEQTETSRADSSAPKNGETNITPPRIPSRAITSKRVVIPPQAKRIAKVSPVALPPPDDIVVAPELTPMPSRNGDDASLLPAPPETTSEVLSKAPEPTTPPPMGTGTLQERFVPPEIPSYPTPLAETTPEETYKPSVPMDASPKATPLTPTERLSPVESLPFTSAEPSSTIESFEIEADADQAMYKAGAGAIVSETAQADLKPIELRPNPVLPSRPSTAPGTGSIRTGGMPYTGNVATFTPLVEQPRKRRSLEWVLWLFAALLLVVALIALVPLLLPNLLPNILTTLGAPDVVATPTQVAIVPPTAVPQPTSTVLTSGEATTAAPVPTNAPLIIPTPPLDGQQLSLVTDAALTGWIASAEDSPHYGDENLHAGTYQGKNLESVLQFNLHNLPRDTKILFAAIELTGRDASRMNESGEWQLELVENSLTTDWFHATPEQIASAKSLGTVGQPLTPHELGVGRVNQFIFSETELQVLEQQFKNGNAVFRLRGPAGSSDNLFSWESGVSSSALNAPTLHLVYIPGRYVIVTNTPEPENVLTAAAYVVRGTDQAKRRGTPTSFPPGVATATPGGAPIVIAAETAIPGNAETAIVRAQLATAIARTTGTYTPTPPVVIILYPTSTPVVIDPNRLSTATPIPPNADLLAIPIDYDRCKCKGRILLLSQRYGKDLSQIMIEPDGTPLGALSGDLYYRLALAREPYSPDRTKRLIYPIDQKEVQQIGYEDLATGEITVLTNFPKGIAYDAAWSPDGNSIAFVSTERGNTDEIWVYDFGTATSTRITDARDLGQPWSKHPSWSPDSQQIVFWSSRSGVPQIWVMNRDGTNLKNISNNDFDERDPVWVK